jgi:hypothetical protein
VTINTASHGPQGRIRIKATYEYLTDVNSDMTLTNQLKRRDNRAQNSGSVRMRAHLQLDGSNNRECEEY